MRNVRLLDEEPAQTGEDGATAAPGRAGGRMGSLSGVMFAGGKGQLQPYMKRPHRKGRQLNRGRRLVRAAGKGTLALGVAVVMVAKVPGKQVTG